MNDFNKTIIIGNICKDPIFKDISGKTLCELTIASNKQYKENKKTLFLEVKIWGMDWFKDKIVKGSKVLIEGSLEQESWDKDGKTNKKIVLIGQTITPLSFMEKKKEEIGLLDMLDLSLEDTRDELPF